MLDLFGIKKEPESAAPGEPARRPAASAVRPGRKNLWVALLAADSLLVMGFGGAVAARVYQHLSSPALPPAAPAERRKPALPLPPAETAKPAPPAPAAKAQEALPAPPEPAKPVPTKAPEAPTASEGEKRHSVPVEFKLKAARAKSVQLAGAFIPRSGKKDMVKGDEGWTLTLYLLPGGTYRYWFVVDGKKRLDRDNPAVEKGASILTLP